MRKVALYGIYHSGHLMIEIKTIQKDIDIKESASTFPKAVSVTHNGSVAFLHPKDKVKSIRDVKYKMKKSGKFEEISKEAFLRDLGKVDKKFLFDKFRMEEM